MSKLLSSVSRCTRSFFNRIIGRTPKRGIKVKKSKLGEGACGSVFKAHDRTSGAKLAAKVVDSTGKSRARCRTMVRVLKTEFELSRVVSCENILEPVDFIENGSDAALVTPRALCDAEHLEDLEEEAIATIVKATLNAVSKLHSAGIIHRDIKAENILITKEYVPKLTDFGIASYISDIEGYTLFDGTYGFVPPTVKDSGYTESSDIYAIGMMAMQLAMDSDESLPIMENNANVFEESGRITTKAYQVFTDKQWVSKDFVRFVDRCLNLTDTPTIDELIKLPFISNALSNEEFKKQVKKSL